MDSSSWWKVLASRSDFYSSVLRGPHHRSEDGFLEPSIQGFNQIPELNFRQRCHHRVLRWPTTRPQVANSIRDRQCFGSIFEGNCGSHSGI
jgi:hypothetical protein